MHDGSQLVVKTGSKAKLEAITLSQWSIAIMYTLLSEGKLVSNANPKLTRLTLWSDGWKHSMFLSPYTVDRCEQEATACVCRMFAGSAPAALWWRRVGTAIITGG